MGIRDGDAAAGTMCEVLQPRSGPQQQADRHGCAEMMSKQQTNRSSAKQVNRVGAAHHAKRALNPTTKRLRGDGRFHNQRSN